MSSVVGLVGRGVSVTRVDKPWGHEIIWATVEGKYVGKVLNVRAGCSLSLQTHTQKIETMYALSGEALVHLGPNLDAVEAVALTATGGRSVTIPAGWVHRLEAMTDVSVVEVSSADPGWQTDVVRIQDQYGREGTNRP